MNKKRVYEVAKDFHVSSEALISLLREMKFEIKSHMSVVTDEMFGKIKTKFEKQHQEAVKDIQKKKKINQAISKDNKAAPPQKKKSSDHNDQRKNVSQQDKKKKKKPNAPEVKKPDQQKAESEKSRKKSRKARAKARKLKMKEHQNAVQDSFKKTMASISTDKHSKKKYRSRQDGSDQSEEISKLMVTEFISVGELANQMDLPVNNIVKKCFEMGMMVSVNQSLDMDTITLLAEEFGYEVEQLGEYGEDILLERDQEAVNEDNIEARPPVVTVMGHVDHGKTTLLDYIREANVVDGEAGGITQHIGAYSVTLPDGNKIAFIDTPGHEAFTAMRARGAKVTDIVILIVGADDSVMPQTIEAIDHSKDAGVPIVIAINKVDLPDADPEKIKGDLARHNILVEDWGGTYQSQEISAKQGLNVGKLLEKVLLEAEMLELKADAHKPAAGVVIDSILDKGRGPVATILVQSGTLRVGDPFISGVITGRVRAMHDEYGDVVEEAGPSIPVQIFGMSGVPKAGDTFYVVESDAEARSIAQHRQVMKREQASRRVMKISLDAIYDKIKDGLIQELKIIIKADVDGSMEAISDALSKITHEEVRVNVIRQGVGGITENDVLLASASDAIIIGFHVRPTPAARALAESEQVEIKLYRIIYEAIEDVQKALSGLLRPKLTEKVVGVAEVRDVFKIPRIGIIAGCYVTNGNIRRNASVKLIRDSIEVYDGKVSSLKRFKDDVTEVNQGYECGLSIDGYDDIKVGDNIEVIEIVEESRSI